MIEEGSHLRGRANPILDFGEALLGMLKHGRNLLGRDTGNPFQELISRRAGFQVLEEGAHGHASSAKDPSAAYFVWERSTSWQSDQSNMQTMICFPFLAGK